MEENTVLKKLVQDLLLVSQEVQTLCKSDEQNHLSREVIFQKIRTLETIVAQAHMQGLC